MSKEFHTCGCPVTGEDCEHAAEIAEWEQELLDLEAAGLMRIGWPYFDRISYPE
jgi:hypothetical protein